MQLLALRPLGFVRLFFSVCLSSSVLLAGCAGGGGGGNGSTTGSGSGTSTPAASLSVASVSPTNVPVGSSAVTLSVTGTGFTAGTVVSLNGVAEATTYVSSTQVQAAVPAAQLTSGKVLQVAVANGTTTVTADTKTVLSVDNPLPTLTSVSPASVVVGATSASAAITGTNFVPGVTVSVNGSPRTTTYVSATQATADLLATDFASIATLAITAVNPGPGGGSSTAAALTVAAKTTPTISSVSPKSFVVNSGDSYLYVYGANLPATSTVLWNGSSLTTSYSTSSTYVGGVIVSAPYLIAKVPASLLTATGTATVTVAVAGAPITNSVSVGITYPPPPTVALVTPSSVPIAADVQVTLTGSGYNSQSTVTFNGIPLSATVNGSASITVTLPASAIHLPGVGTFSVTTPAPGGGTVSGIPLMAYVPVASNSMVYNPVDGLLYLSVPGTVAAPLGNSIVSVNPATGAIGAPIFVGSQPNKLALTADGRYLWVGLDGSSAVRKVDLVAKQAGLQFSLPGNNVGWYNNPPTAVALVALPGSTDSVVVSYLNTVYGGTGIAIFDSGVMRGSAANTTYPVSTIYSLLADGSRNEIYAGGGGYATYTYNSSGLSLKASNTGINPASNIQPEMQIASGRLYTDQGKIYDAESGSLLGTVYNTSAAAYGPTYADDALGKIFVLDSSSSTTSASVLDQVQIFSSSDFTTVNKTIPVSVPSSASVYPYQSALGLVRWGANGLAVHTSNGVYSFQSNTVADLSSVNADLSVTTSGSGSLATGGTTTFTAVVTNAGPSNASDVVLTAALPVTGTVTGVSSTAGSCTTAAPFTCSLRSLTSGASVSVSYAVQELAAGSGSFAGMVTASTSDANLANNSASTAVTISDSGYVPTPTLSGISPAAVRAGASDTTLSLSGSNFTSAATVLIDGVPVPTTYNSSTSLSAIVPQSKLSTLGWSAVSVAAQTGGSTSSTVPLTVYNVISLGANHLIYDPYSRKIMTSISSGSSSITGNSVAAITPDTGSIGTPVSVGSQPGKMALTDDGQVLYTLLTGASAVSRFNMLTGTVDYAYSLTSPSSFDTLSLRDIAAEPGTENTVAIDAGTNVGVALYDFNPASSTASIRGSYSGPYDGSCLQFLDANNLYSFDIDTTGATLIHFPITSSGWGYVNDYSSGSTLNSFGCFKINGGLAFANAGGIANPSTFPATQVATIAGLSGGGTFSSLQALAPDRSLQLAFYPTPTSSSFNGTSGLSSYDLNTYLLSSSLPLDLATIEGASSFGLNDLIRWGQDGLAMLTTTGHIYLVRGPFVVPQLLNTNSAAALTSSSASTITRGSGNTLLTLTGSNFVPGVAVTWNGAYRTTTIIDATHVTVAIPASDLAAAGSGSLVATNPGAGASAALTITIQ